MKNIYKIAAIALAMFTITSCSVSGPLMVTDNPGGPGSKTGVAEYKVILGFKPLDADASIATAAKNGGITKVSTVDTKIKGGFFVATYSTVVTGE